MKLLSKTGDPDKVTSDLDRTIKLVERLASVTVCLSSLEVLTRPRLLSDEGLASWPVSRKQSAWKSNGPLARVLDVVFSYPNILASIVFRLLAALTLILAPLNRKQRGILVTGLAVSSVGLSVRSRYSQDGSDTMSTTIFVPMALEKAFSQDSKVREACVWFVALQSCLSYLASGVAKAVSPQWRNGSALSGIFRTSSYGDRRVYKLLEKRPGLAKWVSRFGVAWESLFPLVLVVPAPLRKLMLLGGVGFHAANAAFMGLSRFFWAFVATYPALSYCAKQLQRMRD